MLVDYARLSLKTGKEPNAIAIYLKILISSVGQDFTEVVTWE